MFVVNADRPKEHQAGSSAYAATSHVRAISASNASAVPLGDATPCETQNFRTNPAKRKSAKARGGKKKR